ncbi:MAG: hypothetical protein AAF546_00210 [Verrucomicrobiota bacterium]
MSVTPINKILKRGMFNRSIERDPADAILVRSQTRQRIALKVRLANPSHSRKLTLAGTHEEIPDLECKVTMPLKEGSLAIYEPAPEPRRDRFEINELTYRIVEVEALPETGCYRATLTLES